MFEAKTPLIPSRKFAAVLLAILAGTAAAAFYLRAQTQGLLLNPAQAQSPAASEMNHDLVVLDPAHGGQDAGATLGDKIFEKDVTLAIATRLRAALDGRGLYRGCDAGFRLRRSQSDDQRPARRDRQPRTRAGLPCDSRDVERTGRTPLHFGVAAAGGGMRKSTHAPAQPAQAFVPVPWEMAQAASVSQSLRLVGDLSAALGKANLPAVAGREPVRPLDNLECPAVVLPLAPLPVAGSDATPVTSADYQQRVAATLTAALQAWRNHAVPTAPSSAATGAGGATTDPAARAAARLAAARAHASLGAPADGQAGSHGQANKGKQNSETQTPPASSSNGPGDQPGASGGGHR